MFQQHLGFKGVLRRQKSRNAFDQTFELFNVKVFEATKIVKHRGLGKALFAVARIMRELDVGGFRAGLIFARNRSDVHVYKIARKILIVK